ncbi:putative transcriptional regulator [Aciduliprofundum sp. MAR08-339]|uniref:MarR family transcriptional regulator n=1 Tax=Aciduliprofundum sp. (strain MAR08-339) TaxID=673860 RepID=UPI0002A47B9B|nr:putative transcriptional regulator [Aciduliprofundum sp. MAR08-339]
MVREEMTQNDEKLASLLQKAGLSRNVARTLAYMYRRDEVTSVQIEKNTGLRQPEVSIAMQWLTKRGWVTKRDIKKEGKGRPVHGYRLAKPFPMILEEIEKDLRARINEIEKLIKDLRAFS